jgi:hypothetical protein
VLPVNTSNNLWVADFCLSIYWILHQAALAITYNTSNYITWTNNFFWFFIWPKLAQTTPEELLCRTARDEFIFQTASIINTSAPYIVLVIHCCQLLVYALPRYMRAHRPPPRCNNSPIVAVARLVVSAVFNFLFCLIKLRYQWYTFNVHGYKSYPFRFYFPFSCSYWNL